MSHYRTHSYRLEVLDHRLGQLAGQIAEFDGTALHPWQVDMIYALTKCPLYMAKRYRKLCDIYARYRENLA